MLVRLHAAAAPTTRAPTAMQQFTLTHDAELSTLQRSRISVNNVPSSSAVCSSCVRRAHSALISLNARVGRRENHDRLINPFHSVHMSMTHSQQLRAFHFCWQSFRSTYFCLQKIYVLTWVRCLDIDLAFHSSWLQKLIAKNGWLWCWLYKKPRANIEAWWFFNEYCH